MYCREAKGGFTLTELLVSTAIFAILMTSIGALFVASLHAFRAGLQSQDAFELSRGTFNVLERDLTTVFTSRDYGQYYQFYGNEYGMMMVGLLELRDANGRQYTRIGRVSYVIYPVVLRGPDGAFYVTEPFALDYDKKMGTQTSGLEPYFRKTHGMRYTATNTASDFDNYEVAVAALVRYVEPGVSDLDSFPFDWNALVSDTEGNPEFPPSANPQSLGAQLDASLESGRPNPSTDYDLLGRLNSAQDQMFAAKKRDLWLQMLSCQKYWIPRLVGAAHTPFLPNPWGRIDPVSGNVVERCWLRGGSTSVVVNPRDYVAIDNLGVFTNDVVLDDVLNLPGHQNYWTTWPLLAYTPKSIYGYKPFFEYGRVTADTSVDLTPFWNANRQAYAGNLMLPPDGIDNDQDGMIDENGPDGLDNDRDGLIDEPDELGERMVIPGTTDPGILDLDPNAYERDGRDNNATNGFDEPGETFVNPIEEDGIDNNRNGTVDEPGETIDSAAAPDMPLSFVAYGSPLQPRLPEAVMVRLPMLYPPAYASAPNFERSMEQLIDVPTAYTRSQLAYENP